MNMCIKHPSGGTGYFSWQGESSVGTLLFFESIHCTRHVLRYRRNEIAMKGLKRFVSRLVQWRDSPMPLATTDDLTYTYVIS